LTRDPADQGLEPDRVEEKIRKGKTWCDPARSGQKPGCNLLTFLLKQRRFDFLKKIDPGDLIKTRNPSLGPGRPSGWV
jgi:hypothetical protein